MKVLVILLALMTVCLSAVPCCVQQIAGMQQHKDGDTGCGDQEKDACDESCSPFYNCGSCTGFSIQNFHYEILYPQQLLRRPIVSRDHFTTDDFHPAAYRPPQGTILS